MNQTPRTVTELFGQYLRRQMAAQAEGLGFADPEGLASPYEAVPMQPVDPRLAWEDATSVLRLGTTASASPCCEAPPDWPSLVAAQEPAIALAFCVGNFPQMVRNLQPLLSGGDLTALRQTPARPVTAPPTLLQWASTANDYPQLLVAVGVLRLARRFEEASELLRSAGSPAKSWRALLANEKAALAWQRGNAEEALTLWQAQKTSVPVLFNRGMAALFLGRPAEARSALEQAADQLPDTSAWHHLGHLYLALAAARS
jgi:tetratricopeptide (TPR) repeat protein